MGKTPIKILASVGVVAALLLSWSVMFKDAAKLQAQYDEYIQTAREKDELELFDEANDNYRAALGMMDTIGLREEIADFYLSEERFDTYIGFCEDTMSVYPKDEVAYRRLAEYYESKGNYSAAFRTIDKAAARNVKSDTLNEISERIKYEFQIFNLGLDDVRVISNGLCAARKVNGYWGYVNSSGKTAISFKYEVAGDFNGSYMAIIDQNKTPVLIDSTSREKSKDASGRQAEDITFLFEDKIAVKFDGKYRYFDYEFNELFGSYDYAGTFNGGVAAVENDGKWFLIDSSGNKISDKTFDEIVVDEKGVSFRNGVAFAKTNGKYILIDQSANQVGSGSWAAVDCFNTDEPAAVSNGTKWGYINAKGEVVIDYTYDEAKSFANGFAAVCNENLWGYITNDNILRIDYQFEQAKDFGPTGTAFVISTAGWDVLSLYSYNH